MKSTNYYNTFIEVAEDCPVDKAKIPLLRGDKKTIARMQYEMIFEHPYHFTFDDVIFRTHTVRKNIPQSQEEWKKFFSKGQACLRSSPLGKRYGWGVHSNSKGKIALFAVKSDEYQKLAADKNLNHTQAMRSTRR